MFRHLVTMGEGVVWKHSKAVSKFTQALQKGDEEAWRCFHREYERRLCGCIASCWFGESDAVEDLAQNTMIRAVKYIRIFDDEQELWSWLTVLARSAVKDYGRKRSRFRRLLELFHLEPREPGHFDDDELRDALNLLSNEEQKLLRWKYDEGYSVREISSKLSITEKAVEARLGKARKSLRKCYYKSIHSQGDE